MATETWVDKDLHLCAALVTLGHRCVGISVQKEGNNRKEIGYFSFLGTKELMDEISRYKAGKCLVEPQLYAANIRSLKSDVCSTVNAPR